MVEIKAIDYYNRPEYYPYMPEPIFNALEKAVTESELPYDEIMATVPEREFMIMVFLKNINTIESKN